MKRTRWAFSIGLLGILLTGIIFWSAGSREPSYQSRSLSSWLDEWNKSFLDRNDPAAKAIQAMGSNSVPVLMSYLSKERSPNERKFWRIAGKIIPEEWNLMNQDTARAVAASEAINLLGPEAQSAFPALTNFLFSKSPHHITSAIALAGMGHNGVAALCQALKSPDWSVRYSAASGLAEARTDLDEVVPALIEVVKTGAHKKEDFLVRGAAVTALVHLHHKPDLVVPMLSDFLTDPDANTRAWAASSLGGFNSDAKSAVPLLLKACTDESPDVREAAKRALSEIAPDAAQKAKVK